MNKLLRKCGEYISRTKSALLTLGLVGASLFANAQTFYGIAGSDLVMFTTTTTSSVTTVGTITGLVMGQSLVGLDFRPATGQLYGLGYDASTGAARLYLINRTTAAATPIGANNLAFMAGETGFGMDFNPTVDRIRVITAGGRNYRLHPTTGAIVVTDGNLAYAAGDVNVGATDAFVACAYTNSYIGATTTALYDIGAVTNALSLQNPPNNGTLNTIGSIGLTINNTTDATDADIYYDAAMNMNMAYLSTKVGATTNFFIPNMMGYDSLMTINLTINMIDTGAMMMGADSLVAAQDSAMYQWINCATGMNISGAMNRVFMPTASGVYSVMVTTAQGCMTTSACISFTLVGVDEVSNTNIIAAYPNPTKGLFTIQNANDTPQMLIISDALGRKVYTANIQGTTTIDLSNLQTGLYYAQLGNNIIKIIKE